MSQVLNLKEVGDRLRQLVQSLRSSNEECEIKDEEGQTVAVVLPAERYESYQVYLRQREQDFAVFDEVDEALKDFGPEELQARVDQAVEEVKTKYNMKRATP